MEKLINALPQLVKALIPVVVFIVVLLAGYILRKIIFIRVTKWAQKTKSQLDDIILDSIKAPFIIWSIMLGMYFAFEVSSLPPNVTNISGKILLVLGMFSVTLVLANIAAGLVAVYSRRIEGVLPGTSLTKNISRIIVLAVGILVILNTLCVSITPILATLGVGGLAVALALQDTLSNLFAGFHILMARQIKIGDCVKLETGEEGYVVDINWRFTKIKMLPNNMVLVPNSKLVQAIIVNYYLPEKEMAVLVNLGVHYKSDLKKVERVTIDVARKIMKETPGAVPEFEPFIRYNAFADFSINFTVILRAQEFADQYLVKHEFIKMLHERYNAENIIIPYPIRAVNYEQEGAR
ncbi:MAG: mechanosensitive ion channel family protein [Candidatus Omnitrophica bacterium]|nr:mechanosensitive ion channel family protein [Candidatus Omnitrophota bacterium]